MTAEEIAKQAAALVSGDRATTHGDKVANYTNVAHIWNGVLMAAGILNKPMTALDACNLMEALKIARRYSGRHNVDDYVDGAGYAACAGEIAEKLKDPNAA